jgi:tyrosine-protein kinase Etk/Wzc
LLAEEGQKFIIAQGSTLKAGRALRGALGVAEQGKKTGIISVHFSHRYPDRAASILNTIAKTYLRQNVEMRSAEAEKTLEFLESQLPMVKAKLDSAEKVLADYRYKIGSIDMTGETKAHISKETELKRQILEMEQKRQAAMRLFKAEHPSVVTLSRQLGKLRSELNMLKKSAQKMPLTQQEVARLQEEVAVNNEIYTNMLNNIQQLRVVRVGEVGNVRIVDLAQVESMPSKPKRKKIFLIAVAIGFLVGVFYAYLMYMLKNGVRSASEIERETKMNVLVKIPKSRNILLGKRAKMRQNVPFVLQRTEDQVTESFQSMMTAINFSFSHKEHSVILVMGLISGVGKSFVSQNLSAIAATSGKKVLLIDADMRRGSVRTGVAGLADVLVGKKTLDEAVQQKYDKNMFVLNAGKTNMTACGLLRSDAMENLLKEARQKYDLVIVDTPPLNLVTDAELICPFADYLLFVLQYGKHRMDDIKESLSKIVRYSGKQGAVVLNQYEYEPGHYGYYEKEYNKQQPQDYKRFSFASLFFLLGSRFGGRQ